VIAVPPSRAPSRRRVLIATPVSPRLSMLAGPSGAATLLPELAARPAELAAALARLRPHTLVVGANAVDAEALDSWAAATRSDSAGTNDRERGDPDRGDRSLLLVRRGTSLAAIDLAAAARLGITVRNTPEVNARHVAQFMIEKLFGADGPPSRVLGLLGAGNINGRVARAGAARGLRLVVCAPSLVTDPAAAVAWARRHDLPAELVHVAADVAEVAGAADALAVAVPLVHRGGWATEGMIDADRLSAFGGSRLVSVSEPEVFTESALLDAYDRRDLSVVLDNAPRLLAPVRTLLATRVAGDGGSPRPGFTLCSAAMRTPACDADLDQAVLAVVGRADLDDLSGADLLTPTDRRVDDDPAPEDPAAGGHGVVVVGGGIVGLTTALLLHARGHRDIAVLDAAPADRADPGSQGTTFAGTNGRHLSATESLPPADPTRADVLTRGPGQRGWRLRDPAELTPAETAWAEAFAQRADQPGLHATAQDLAIALNRLGLRGWQHLFARDGGGDGWLAGLRRDARLARIYLGAADLDAGEQLQRAADTGAVRLPAATLGREWPGLATVIPLPGGPREITGAVEVDGYAVNIHDLATALAGRLAALGIEVRADTRVRLLTSDAASTGSDSISGTGSTSGSSTRSGTGAATGVRLKLGDGEVLDAARVVVTVGGPALAELFGDTGWPGAGAVSQVLGVSLTLPNPGLRRPAKIHAGDPLGVMNVTLSPDGTLIHVSAGFGYLGLAHRKTAQAGVAELRGVVERAVAGLFPTLVGADGRLKILDTRFCERPATPDGLPLVTALEDLGGRVVVAAGTNAGGAVQAPALALLAADLLTSTPRCAGLALAGERIGLPRVPEEAPRTS